MEEALARNRPSYSCKDEEEEEEEEEDQFWDCSSTDAKDNNVDDDQVQRKIATVRAFLLSQHPSAKEVDQVDDPMIRRFLRARDFNTDKASALLLKCLTWRHTFVPNNHVFPSEICNDLSHNKFFLQGLDKQARPIMVTYGARHKPSKAGTEEFKRYIVYCLDKVCARMPRGQENFVCIADLEGWGYSNSDIRGYIAALSILQDCYPERLGKLFIVHVPYIFMAAWKVIYPFIDSNTKKKIVFVENKKLRPTLLADIDESQLPETYGGKLPLVPIQDS